MSYDPRKAFALKPLWARFLIVFAGPGMNLVLAAVIFMLVFATVGRPVWPPVVGRVTEGSPGAEAGAHHGDRPLSFLIDVRERTTLWVVAEHGLDAQAQLHQLVVGAVTEIVVAERGVKDAVAGELQQLDGGHGPAAGRHLEDVVGVDDLTRRRHVVHLVHGWPPFQQAGTELYASWLVTRQLKSHGASVYARSADPGAGVGVHRPGGKCEMGYQE